MNLKTFVKVGNISNLSDARYCAGFGVNMLGFNLNPDNKDAISVDTAKEIMGWIAGSEFVLEFGDQQSQSILPVLSDMQIDNCQVSDIDVANELVNEGKKVIFEYQISSEDELNELEDVISTLSKNTSLLVIDSTNSDLYIKIDSKLDSLGIEIDTLRAYHVNTDNLADIMDSSSFKGVALKGSYEEKPGFKDYDELADILELLEDE